MPELPEVPDDPLEPDVPDSPGTPGNPIGPVTDTVTNAVPSHSYSVSFSTTLTHDPVVIRSNGISPNSAKVWMDRYPPLPKSASWVGYTSVPSVVVNVPVILIGIVMIP